MQKKFGDETLERIGQGLQSIYESQPMQDFRTGLGTFGGFAKDFVDTAVGRPFDYLAQEATKLGAAKFYPTPSSKGVSALGAITPENPVSFTDSMKAGGGQTVYDPVTGGQTFVPERGFVPEMKRAGAQIGSVFDMMFGDARRAGERMNEGVDFKDLTPEQRLGVRFFLLDILPIPGVGPAAKSAQVTKAATQAQKKLMEEQFFKGSVGAKRVGEDTVESIRNRIGDFKDDEFAELATFYNDLPDEVQGTIQNLFTKQEKEKFARYLNKNLSAFEKSTGIKPTQFIETLKSPNALLDDKTLQNFATYYDTYLYQTKANTPGKLGSRSRERQTKFFSGVGDEQANKLITTAEQKGLLKVRDIAPSRESVLKPEGQKYIRDNFFTMPSETIRENMNKDLAKYFYTDVAGNRYNVDTYQKFRNFAQYLGLEKGDAAERLIKNRIKPIQDEFDKVLASKEIDITDPFAVKQAFRNAVEKVEGKSRDSMGDSFYDFLELRRKAHNDTNPELKILSMDELSAFKVTTDHANDVLKYYQKNFAKDKALRDINQSTEFRFFNNIERTRPNLSIEEFFKLYKPKDIKEGGKLYTQFQKFKKIDETRIEAQETLKPILDKIFKKIRVGTAAEGKIGNVNTSLQIAHKYITQGIGNFVGKDKIGTGADPAQLIIDISEYNAYMQAGLESQARIYYNRYARDGLESDYQKLVEIDNAMKTIGVQGEIAPGQTIGRAMPIDEKISSLMIEAMDAGAVTQKDVNQAIKAANRIAKNKKDYEKMFKEAATFNQGGLVGDMIPVKASVGKFIKGLFGETPAYRKEGMDVESLFGPTKKQKETLEKLYPGTAFPETYPGEVFYSNFDLALSRRGAPESFQNEDSFRNYMNQSGVGTDELDDAKVIPYIKSKSQAGETIFSQDLRRIANQSPIRSVFMDAYGFRSDKINQASRDFFDPNTGSRVQIEGEAVYKDPAYPTTAIMDGALSNSYRERVFRVKKDQLRGDPGSVPGGADNHKFGGSADTDGNYTLFWTRQTDRPAFIIPGEIVDKKTGEIIQPAMIADQTKLKGIEDRIQKLFADPIAKLDPQDLEGVSATVKRLVDSSAGRLTSGKAFNVVMGQIDAKQKQIKRLQNEYNAEKQTLDSFVSPQKKEIITTTIDELQSDILQSLRTKSRNIAGKLKIMADRNMSIDSMRDKELLEYFKETGGVVRPLGKTKEELIDQFNQLKEINQQLKESSKKFAFGITEGDLNYYNSVKQMQKKIMDEMTNNISKDLMQKLYPDVPLKDRVQYADAAVKQAVAEAAYRLFVEKDPNAPKYISYMSGSQIKSNYTQPGGAATPAAERAADLDNRQRRFEQDFAGGNEGATLEQSDLRGIGTEEFYGGPDVKNEQGAHFTGVMENIFKKVANEYGSKIEIANVATETPRVRDVYNIVDQDTGIVMGSGDTFRQAENIANDLVDKEGGRYRIATETERVYDSRPIFTMEITPEMLQLFKAYK